MDMKRYFAFIGVVQETLLALSIGILVCLPVLLAYIPMSDGFYTYLFSLSLASAFLVLSIRPLADLLSYPWVRPLVMLRKGFGVFSASLIVSIAFSKIMVDGTGYFAHFLQADTWSLAEYAFLAPLADISAFVLLITSNKFSKRVLGPNWKRVQKLAYVYFYAGAFYEYLVFHDVLASWYILIVATVSILAFLVKRMPRPALSV